MGQAMTPFQEQHLPKSGEQLEVAAPGGAQFEQKDDGTFGREGSNSGFTEEDKF